MDEKENIREFFVLALENLIGDDIEKITQLRNELSVIKKSSLWNLFFKILSQVREEVIQAIKTAEPEINRFLVARSLLIAIDYLLFLPEELIKILDISVESKEGQV